MKRILLIPVLVLCCASFVFGQAPTLTQTTPTAVNQGQNFTFTCATNCGGGSWTLACTDSAGMSTTCPSGAAIVSGTGVYTADTLITTNQSLGGCQMFPNNMIQNVDISGLPVNSNNAAWMTGDLATYVFQLGAAIPYNIIDNTTPTQTIATSIGNPSGQGTYQVLGPPSGKQQNGWYYLSTDQNDHHLFEVNHTTCQAYELYQNAAIYNPVSQNNFTKVAGAVQYPMASYTSPTSPSGSGESGSDVAATPMMAEQLHLQEFLNAYYNGIPIKHAMRMTLDNSNIHLCNVFTEGISFLWPAGNPSCSGSGLIPEGARARMKASFDCSAYDAQAQIICTAWKHYGVILQDGGFHEPDIIVDDDAWPNWVTIFNTFSFASGLTFNNVFEWVDESSLKISNANGECICFRETVTYTTGGGSASVDVMPIGVTLDVNPYVLNIQAGSPAQQLTTYVNGTSNTSVTWTIPTPASASITYGGSSGVAGFMATYKNNGSPIAEVHKNNNQNAGSGSTTATILTSQSSGNGNLCTVWWADDSGRNTPTTGDTVAVTDTAGNSYVLDLRYNSSNMSGSADAGLALFRASSISTAASNTITGTITSSNTVFYAIISCSEWTNFSASPLDQIGNFLDSSGYISPAITSTPTSPSQAGEMYYAFFDAVSNSASPAAGSGYTALNTTPGLAGSSIDEYQITSSLPSPPAQVGTLTSGGLYTPPANLTSSDAVAGLGATILTATSAANANVHAFVQLNVLPNDNSGKLFMFGTDKAINQNAAQPWPFTDGNSHTWQSMLPLVGETPMGVWDSCSASIPPWQTADLKQIDQRKLTNGNDLRIDLIVPNGSYTTRAGFAECTYNSAGQATVNLEAQGNTLLSGLDVYSAAGGTSLAYTYSSTPISVTNNHLAYVIRSVIPGEGINGMSSFELDPIGINGSVIPAGVKITGVSVQ